MYAEILLTQKIGEKQSTLTYQIPENLKVRIGNIVETPLRSKNVKGVVFRIFQEKPGFATKPISRVLENAPHLEPWQIKVLQWISEYYFCPLSKALKLFLPIPFIKKKKLLEYIPEGISPYGFEPQHRLSDQQKLVLKQFDESKKETALLHGVTGSGKTEIYLHAADKKLKEGYQVLMLIPEISLTTQTVERFKNHFKQKIAVIHSQLTPHQKELEWMRIHKGEARIIIGSRSAIFAPFQKLGLIIIDEEHDDSYKQDQAPRYHTLKVALQIGALLKIKILMGSATPSLENYYQALLGNYELLELPERAYGEKEVTLPTTKIVDLREEIKKKNFSIFSDALREKIAEKLAKKEQIILFLNRRGAASAVLCRECGYLVKCPNCDVPMTYHNRLTAENLNLKADRLICHHCGKIEKIPSVCPHCSSVYIRYLGLGTQKVEDEISKIFSLAKVLRADRDTISKKNAFKKMYLHFKNHEADILVGTQMIALGLHLPDVNLVGIILADTGLTIPNFRSNEKTFQIITQVSGRAGRETRHGEVVIQTYLPNHYAIIQASKHDYKGFYEQEIEVRKSLNYPPFTKLIKLTITHKKAEECEKVATQIFDQLKNLDTDKNTHITSYPALIPKFQKKYRWNILISGENPSQLLNTYLRKTQKNFESKVLKIDVDPLSTV